MVGIGLEEIEPLVQEHRLLFFIDSQAQHVFEDILKLDEFIRCRDPLRNWLEKDLGFD